MLLPRFNPNVIGSPGPNPTMNKKTLLIIGAVVLGYLFYQMSTSASTPAT